MQACFGTFPIPKHTYYMEANTQEQTFSTGFLFSISLVSLPSVSHQAGHRKKAQLLA